MHVLYIEPFCGGSHEAFLETLSRGLRARFDVQATLLTMPGRHWKWRMRGAVPWLAERHDAELRGDYDLVFASSFLPLAELVGLYPRLGEIPRVLYFHENQLAYPVRGPAVERDMHYGFTQMTSALAASCNLFNSRFNMESFLAAGEELLRRMPDARPTKWRERVAEKSDVLGLPLDVPLDGPLDVSPGWPLELPEPAPSVVGAGAERSRGPVLLWNHRWEHDKNPGEFFAALAELRADGVPFRVIVCGESFRDIPSEILAARAQLGDRILHWGYAATRDDYFDLLGRSDAVVSTARHEYFGLSVLEATWMGARPVVPDRLVYPELFPEEFLYTDLVGTLSDLCDAFVAGDITLRADRKNLVAPFLAGRLLPEYYARFDRLVRMRPGNS